MIEKLEELLAEFHKSGDNIQTYLRGEQQFSDDIFLKPYVFKGVDDRPYELTGKKGIYIFVIDRDVPVTHDQVRAWNDICKGASFNYWYQGDLLKGDVLYLGSCISESLYVRIRHHFLSETTTTSLRLGHKARCFVKDSVQVYAFPIKDEYLEYARLIIPSIEKYLHKSLKPKAGSSRV